MNTNSELVFYSKLNETFELPDQPSKCRWSQNAKKDGVIYPHTKQEWKKSNTCQNVTEAIGNTPLVKLNKIPQAAGLNCSIYGKCEYLNPGGSAKDRVAKRMIEDAERHGILKPGMTIIESSSGNAGIALALQAAIKGYKSIIIISEFSVISQEKLAVLNALGAELVRTPFHVDLNDPDGFIGAATKIRKQTPNSVILDQFTNPASPLAHYDTTAEELLFQLDGKIDMVVIGAGTGGTISGIGRKLKERNPNVKIIGVDPIGSTIALPEELNESDDSFFEVDGIGFCFVSPVLDRNLVDMWVKVSDKEAMRMARKMIREEGLLVGTLFYMSHGSYENGDSLSLRYQFTKDVKITTPRNSSPTKESNSSGAILQAALKAAKDLDRDQNVVIMLPDGVRNYLSTFLMDPWMEYRGYQKPPNKKHWWWEIPVRQLNLSDMYLVKTTDSCCMVLDIMEDNQLSYVGVLDSRGGLAGMVFRKNIVNKYLAKDIYPDSRIEDVMLRQYLKVKENSTLGLLSRLFEMEEYVIVISTNDTGSAKMDIPLGACQNSDVLKFVRDEEIKSKVDINEISLIPKLYTKSTKIDSPLGVSPNSDVRNFVQDKTFKIDTNEIIPIPKLEIEILLNGKNQGSRSEGRL